MSQHSCDVDDLLRLAVEDRKLRGILHIKPTEHPSAIDGPTLVAYLEGAGVRSSAIDHAAVEILVQQLHADPMRGHSACVATGTAPTRGRDSKIQLDDNIQSRLEKIKARKSAFEAAEATGKIESADDKEGKIDFYTMSPFLVVDKGDSICKIIPSTLGRDGIDIFGETIPAVDGRDVAKINDPSVRVSKDGNVSSAIPGLLQVGGDSIKVSSVLEVSKNVDFSTANIGFPGDVIVNGGVLDNFVVQADGTITIRKLVQESTVRAEGDITLEQGMAGKDNGVLVAGKNLHAGYLEAVNAVVGGDCTVDHEVTNSTLTITGKLIAPNAAIRGGEISIANEATVGIIGSIQGVQTTLVLGHLPEISMLIRRSQDFADKIEQELDAKRKKLEAFKCSFVKPNASQIEEQMGMEFEISELESKSAALDTATQRLLETQHGRTKIYLNVKKSIYAKSVVFTPGYKIVFTNDVEGESVIELPDKGEPTLTYLGTSRPLKQYAKVYPDDRTPRVVCRESTFQIAA